jgi:ABC-2 type transport system permease protein
VSEAVAELGRVFRAAPAMFRIAFADVVAYRAEMAIWVLSATMPLIMLALWNAVAAEGPIAGFGQVEIARYFAATLVVRQLTGAWILWQLNYLIRHGGLSPLLLRPMPPLLYEAASMLTAMPFRIVILMPFLALLVAWRPELWAAPSLPSLALFAVSVSLAWMLSFLIQALFGMASFWLDQSLGLFGVWFAAWGLFSGYVAPTAMFPAWFQPILHWLPFRGMLGLPVEILGGFLDWRAALPEVGIQLGWVVVMGLLVRYTWKRGVIRYGAHGA